MLPAHPWPLMGVALAASFAVGWSVIDRFKARRRRRVVLYSAMSCDLYHYGHAAVLQKGIEVLKQRVMVDGDDVDIIVLVGLCSDETVASYKRQPILTLRERAETMRSCRYCDSVIEDAPAVTDAAFMKKHAIDYVVMGDDYTDASVEKWFPGLGEARTVRVPYCGGISTSDIIRRCQAAPPVEKMMSNIHS